MKSMLQFFSEEIPGAIRNGREVERLVFKRARHQRCRRRVISLLRADAWRWGVKRIDAEAKELLGEEDFKTWDWFWSADGPRATQGLDLLTLTLALTVGRPFAAVAREISAAAGLLGMN